MDAYSYIANAHGEYLDQLYKSYQADPASVDISWQKFFEGFDFAQQYPAGDVPQADGEGVLTTSASTNEAPNVRAVDLVAGDKETQVRNLIYAYRSRGHLVARTNPVRERKDRKARLHLADFGLSEADLDTKFRNGEVIGLGTEATLREIVAALQKIYTRSIGFEYMYIRDPQVLDWFREKVEHDSLNFNPTKEYKKRILSKLNEAVVFENFLHTKFLGQKRFSLEGGETTIPALDAIIRQGCRVGGEGSDDWHGPPWPPERAGQHHGQNLRADFLGV